MQAEFLDAGDSTYPTNSIDDLNMCISLVREEFYEWEEENPWLLSGYTNDLKEAIDLIYVVAQYLNKQVGPEKAAKLFEAVHTNNMAKCTNGKLVKREDGKILKPEGFDKDGWRSIFDEILAD